MPAIPKKINAFHLKTIAIAAMLINHIGHNFGISETHYGFYVFSLVIGKLTFPIMAFLLTDGYRHTRNIKRYALRLAVFWLLSVVPFWLAFYAPGPFGPAQLVNNIMFTLLMGLLLLICTDRVSSRILRAILVLTFSLLTLQSDWPFCGVIMLYGFHRIKAPGARATAPILYTMALYILLLLSASLAPGINLSPQQYLTEALVFLGMLLPIPLLLAYNGERGYSPGWIKWGFYIFYPLHLLVIGLLSAASPLKLY